MLKQVILYESPALFLVLNARSASGGMPEANNLDQRPSVINSIDNSVGSCDELSNRLIAKLRHHATTHRKLTQASRTLDEESPELDRAFGIVERNVSNDVLYV
jgi:hypothetical protein